MSEKENQIFTDYLGDPISMCKRIAELEAERDRLREALQSLGEKMEELFGTLAAIGITRVQEKHRNEMLSWFDSNGKALEDSDELAD